MTAALSCYGWRVERQRVLWMTEWGSLCWMPKWNSVLFLFGMTCWVFLLWKGHVTLSPLFLSNQILLFLFWSLLLWLCAGNSHVLKHYVSKLCVSLSECPSVLPSLSFFWKWSLNYAWKEFIFYFNNELILIWRSKIMFTVASQNTFASQIHCDIIMFCKKMFWSWLSTITQDPRGIVTILQLVRNWTGDAVLGFSP